MTGQRRCTESAELAGGSSQGLAFSTPSSHAKVHCCSKSAWSTSTQVDAELAAEAEEQAKLEAEAEEVGATFARVFSCGACGEAAMPGRYDGLCRACHLVALVVESEEAVAQVVAGYGRRELVERYRRRVAELGAS